MKEKLRVLFAAFEAAPFMKTGGLGDVAASLPGAVQCPTIEMRVVLPKLRQIPAEYQKKMKFLCSFYVLLGWRSQYCGLFELRRGGVTWYFLDNEYYFGRDGAYGYFDDGERMAFFAKAICECCRYLPDFFPEHSPLQRLAHGARAGVSARAVPLRPRLQRHPHRIHDPQSQIPGAV